MSANITNQTDIAGPVISFYYGAQGHGKLKNLLKTTPNYLLGVEDKEEDAFVVEMNSLLRQISDDKAKTILLAQIKVIVSI
ncbi:MAG: hypothetical protein J6I76_02110 [Oribacterium sp.]|nr:hypothetical protein [Oribacterium sp.]MBP3802682.1 hypothetical protein [Oribacterium sp.]